MCCDFEKIHKDRISAFKEAVKEGPYFVCVVCNRCMYKKSMKHFDANKYEIEFSNIFRMQESSI